MAPPLLQLKDIALTFGGTPLLTGAELSVSTGERVSLVGRNGSGKSTLLKIAAGLVEPDRGSVFVQPGAVYSFLRWFHAPATAVMVATPSLKEELAANGFRNLRIWTRGVDVDHFRPMPGASLPFPRPIWLYVGRVAVEKNTGLGPAFEPVEAAFRA